MNRTDPVVVRLRYDGPETAAAVTYRSSVGELRVPAVEKFDLPPYGVHRDREAYVIQLTLPWDVPAWWPTCRPKPR